MITLNEVQELHQAGKHDEAKLGYLQLLEKNPDDITVLHFIAILYAEEGNLDLAQQYLEKAIHLDERNSTLYLHLANILKAKGLLTEAEHALQKLIAINPKFAAGFNNLGTIYFAQKKWQEAVTAFDSALQLQANYVDAYYNLGLALNKLHRQQEAMNAYQALLQLSPHHPGAQFHLGSLLMGEQRYHDAIFYFHALQEEHPFHFETQSNLATCYLKEGHLDKAKIHYLKALELLPDDTQILFNLGVIAMQQGFLPAAIDYYQAILRINPNHYEAHNNLGVTYLACKETEKALWHFRMALRLQTDDRALQHTIDILLRDPKITNSPKEYIRALFDSYADHFDAHLTLALDYQVPTLFYRLLKPYHDVAHKNWDILDLGCGTGLCGEKLKPFARSLTGLDLSEKMLNEAYKKAVYDKLELADLLNFVEGSQEDFDVIIAGDVLVYMGDLNPIFAGIYKALRTNGLFLFNTEISNEQDYFMAESGRFMHSKEYLDHLIATYPFTILAYEQCRMRTQNEQAVFGHVYLLKK